MPQVPQWHDACVCNVPRRPQIYSKAYVRVILAPPHFSLIPDKCYFILSLFQCSSDPFGVGPVGLPRMKSARLLVTILYIRTG